MTGRKKNQTGARRSAAAIAASVLALTLTACAVGPDFRRPEAPKETTYTAGPLSAETATADVPGGAAQRFVPAEEIPSQWWTVFHSPVLDQVIRQALKENPSLAAAGAML